MRISRPKTIILTAAAVAAIASFVGVTAASAGVQATPGMPSAKAARVQAEINNANSAPKAAKAGVAQAGAKAAGATTPQTDTFAAGIVDVKQGPFSVSEFVCRNMYRAHVGGRWLFVFAGESTGALSQPQSAVRVYAIPDGGVYGYVGAYSAPTNVGALHVASVKGTTLTLVSDSGTTTTFDLTTLQYQ